MTKQQTIQRSPHNKENPYVSILRTTAQDKRLSYEARGLLAYLLSKPLDWRVQVTELQHEDYAGRDKVQRILKELAAAGYITRPQKYQDKQGKWCWNPYYVWEEPQLEPLTENPFTGNQSPDSRPTDEPSTENTVTYISENHKSKITNQRSDSIDPDVEHNDLTNASNANDKAFGRVFAEYEKVLGGTFNPADSALITELLNLFEQRAEDALMVLLQGVKGARKRTPYWKKGLSTMRQQLLTPEVPRGGSSSPRRNKTKESGTGRRQVDNWLAENLNE